MAPLPDRFLPQIQSAGFAVLPAVFSGEEVDAIRHDLVAALSAPPGEGSAVRGQDGTMYAARNLLTVWPPVATVWRRRPLVDALRALLGPGYGLVRVLYFDKPPGQTWALPWHKDMTIAVKDNRLPSARFGKPTRKAGVPHVEAPRELLEAMLTARLHLDDVAEENGPLKVIPGSHHTGKAAGDGSVPPATILARRGDVLLIRPLVEHASGRSHADTRRHRRILHLEFAATGDLPDGYAWHDFIPGGPDEDAAD
jgi:hypothetical protein